MDCEGGLELVAAVVQRQGQRQVVVVSFGVPFGGFGDWQTELGGFFSQD